ncbi:hypothetical protein RUM43_014250 [Polyplax serrata]|uniref:Uncharacterized protein n=1 Tax=Polyplax serrata TaxID=468196 RepID=A0AAN8Q282_POLSC
MSPVSKPMVPNTWVRRLSQAVDHRYTSDGNSSSYSSAEDNQRQRLPMYVMNDDLSGRSYVDPWDMENYSFLQKQFEDLNVSDSEIPQAVAPTQSDFYYVPLDNNGSPQYQYKRYVDKDGLSPQSLRSDGYGLMANIDEYDFYNDHFDSNLSFLQFGKHPNYKLH